MTEKNAAQPADQEIEAIMEQAQVFASAWAFLGGPFDNGSGLEQAEREKSNLRALLSKLRAHVAEERITWIADYEPLYYFAQNNKVDYNALCTAVRAALASAPVAREALGWRVRERRSDDGKLLDCFVEAPAAPGMAYAQEVLGDDYAEAQGGIEGKLKHCQMIVAWANAAPQASEAVLHTILHSVRQARIAGNDWRRELALIENTVDAALSAQPGAQKESRDE